VSWLLKTSCDRLSNTAPYRKEVDFESGKVLLSRLGDRIQATSAWCTHFGAPLSKGVLAADGRVVW
jgi:nitrite reductase/ring-hydroxylating ferredoxin subunit